ncbi:MAG: hypothetical protein KBF88_03480 [Polyangiaceae bacterium]|nr:hypothetical protein [Polyangiaceae bacterium]
MKTKNLSFVSSLLFCSYVACGGGIEGEDPDAETTDVGLPDNNVVTVDGSRPDAVGKDTGPIGPRPDGSTPDASKDGGPFVDKPCPDAATPPPQFDCNVQNQTGCNLGEGCYPYVDYPEDRCGKEIYGSLCAPAGKTPTGQVCGSVLECAPGNVCVITGAGTKCAKSCDITKAGQCPEGQVCDPVDVAGVGVCN